MTQAHEIWSSQLRIAAGRAVEEAPQVGFAEQRDQRGRLVRLSILAEPVAAGADAFMDQFVRRLGELFDPAARSLTGAIRHAIETAHEELRDWNRQHLPEEHAMYGVSCLIQRADQPALLAQAGPSVGLLAGDAGLAGLRAMALYAHQIRGDDPISAAVGGSDALNVEFVLAPAASDGWALLLSSNGAALLDPERRVALSRLAVDETLQRLYPSMVNLRDAAALVVSLGTDDRIEHSGGPGAETGNEAGSGHEQDPEYDPAVDQADDPAVDDASGADLEEPRSDLDETERDRESVNQDRSVLESRPQIVSERTAMEEPAKPAKPGQPRAGGWELSFAPSAPGELEAVGWPVNPFAVTSVDRIQPMAASLATAPPSTKPIMELGRAIPSLLEQRNEPAVERPKIRPRDPRTRAATARRVGLVLLGMLVVLIGVAAVLLGPSLLQSDEDQFRSRVERARNGLAASQLAVTTEGSRLSLHDALSDVEAALEINPLAEDALQLREEIEAVLAELNLVQSPGELTTIADLSRFGPSIALGTVRFGAGRAFVLDDAGGRVFSVTADGAVSVIFLEGELLGLGGQLRAGKPISLAWQMGQTGQTGRAANGVTESTAEEALWILDSHARLFRWTPSGVLLVPIPDQVRLGSVDAVAATAGGIYLLDQAGGAVWRFATERSELSEPVRAVGRTDLLEASELVARVTASGEVEFLVASSDGRLRRFSGDEELPLALGLQQPLLNPASISTGAQSGLIFVVDRGEARIVAVGPDGSVVNQIQSAALSELRGAWVDERSGQIIYALPSSVLIGRLGDGQE